MSYSTVEAQVQTLIQALDTYADADVTRGDYRVLDRGSAPYVVLRPGTFDNEMDYAPTRRQRMWIVILELFEKHLGDGTEQTNLQASREELMDTFDKYPTLNALSTNVTGCRIVSGEPPVSIYDEDGGGPFFLMQSMTMEVYEKHVVTGGEYA